MNRIVTAVILAVIGLAARYVYVTYIEPRNATDSVVTVQDPNTEKDLTPEEQFLVDFPGILSQLTAPLDGHDSESASVIGQVAVIGGIFASTAQSGTGKAREAALAGNTLVAMVGKAAEERSLAEKKLAQRMANPSKTIEGKPDEATQQHFLNSQKHRWAERSAQLRAQLQAQFTKFRTLQLAANAEATQSVQGGN